MFVEGTRDLGARGATRSPGCYGLTSAFASRLVGAAGFEPATSWSRTKRASRAAPHPEKGCNNLLKSSLECNASSA